MMNNEIVDLWLRKYLEPQHVGPILGHFAQRGLEIQPDGSCGRCHAPIMIYTRGRVCCPGCSRHHEFGFFYPVRTSTRRIIERGEMGASGNHVSTVTRQKIRERLTGNSNAKIQTGNRLGFGGRRKAEVV